MERGCRYVADVKVTLLNLLQATSYQQKERSFAAVRRVLCMFRAVCGRREASQGHDEDIATFLLQVEAGSAGCKSPAVKQCFLWVGSGRYHLRPMTKKISLVELSVC